MLQIFPRGRNPQHSTMVNIWWFMSTTTFLKSGNLELTLYNHGNKIMKFISITVTNLSFYDTRMRYNWVMSTSKEHFSASIKGIISIPWWLYSGVPCSGCSKWYDWGSSTSKASPLSKEEASGWWKKDGSSSSPPWHTLLPYCSAGSLIVERPYNFFSTSFCTIA